MSFSASWLALREPFDHAARSPALIAALRQQLTRVSGETIRVLDLACGSGSNFRYLHPKLAGGQHWTMVDNDAGLLALLPGGASAGLPGEAATVLETVCLDLVDGLDRLPIGETDLVTASALLDLVSEQWLARLLDLLAPRRPVLLLALSYDGSMQWQPGLPDDAWVTGLFNRHQRTDKGFGPALGPAAADQAARGLRACGYTVTTAASDWLLQPADRVLQQAMVTGIAEALGSLQGGAACDVVRLRHWSESRLALVAAGRSIMQVGHTDLLALPGSGGRG